MAENLTVMDKVAKLLGVDLGEEFIIENADRKETVVLTPDGLHVILPNNVMGPDNDDLLSKVLQGLYKVKEKPWKPKLDEEFYSICFSNIKQPPYVYCYRWRDDEFDFCKLGMGIVYRTKAEAEAHLADDYQRLTGKTIEV